jgi:membrane fusion protein, multidrug efflux system
MSLLSLKFLRSTSLNQAVFAILLLIIAFLSLWFVALKLGKPVARTICIAAMSAGKQGGINERPARVIEAQTINVGTVSKRINTVGNIWANAIVIIKSEISGKIAELFFTEGGKVKKGDLIIRFEDAEYRGAALQAEGELEYAQSNFERTSKLHAQNVESRQNFDGIKAKLKSAEGKMQQAKSRLEQANIKAPFDGIIGIMNINAGAFVQAGTELVTLVDNSPVKVNFKVSEKNIHDIVVGQVFDVKVSAFKNQVFTGTIKAVDTKSEKESHSVEIKGVIANPDNLLRDGMFANISLIIGEKSNALTVDESCVERQGEVDFVWIIERGRAERKRVLTGSCENGQVEIIAGLQPDQIVVTSGQLKLSDGIRVKISNMPEIKPK